MPIVMEVYKEIFRWAYLTNAIFGRDPGQHVCRLMLGCSSGSRRVKLPLDYRD